MALRTTTSSQTTRTASPGVDNYVWQNKEYEQLANNLPEFQYTAGILDKLGALVGARTEEVKANDEYANYRANLLAQLKQLDQETKYNSAEEQAQRLRDAGQNPDLTGGIEPGEAGEVDNQAANAPDSGTPELEQIMTAAGEVTKFAGMVATGVSTCLAAAQTMGSIELADTNTRNAIYGEVEKLVEGRWRYDNENNELMFKSPYYTKDYTTWSKAQNEDDIPGVIAGSLTFNEFRNNPTVKQKWHSRRQQMYAYRAFNDILNNLNTETKGKRSIVENREANKELGQSLEDYTQENVKAARNFYKDIEPALLEIEKISTNVEKDFWTRFEQLKGGYYKAGAQANQYKFNSNYYSKLEPDWAAKFQNKYNEKNYNYYDEWFPRMAAKAENNKNNAYNENIGIVMELNVTYNNMIKKELDIINKTKDPVEKGLHIMFLQALTSGKAGNQSFLQGAGQAAGIGKTMGLIPTSTWSIKEF